MNRMKTRFAVLMTVMMTLGLTACSTGTSGAASDAGKTSEQSAAAEEQKNKGSETGSASQETAETQSAGEDTAHPDVLVVYFSATGTTKGVAEKIASITGGDLYEILPAEPYTDDDLNYSDNSSRATKEQSDVNARPEIGSEDISLEGYQTVYLGFPIWWGEEPRIMDTFAEKYSFEGITVIPFCTSGSSDIGNSGPNMKELAGSGTWLTGKRFSGSVTEDELKSWIDSLK